MKQSDILLGGRYFIKKSRPVNLAWAIQSGRRVEVVSIREPKKLQFNGGRKPLRYLLDTGHEVSAGVLVWFDCNLIGCERCPLH